MKIKSTFRFTAMIFPAMSILLLSACGGKQETTSSSTQYETMTIGRTSQRLDSRYSATLRGKQDVEIRPQVSGTITELCVEEGATVHQGQTICCLLYTSPSPRDA